MEKFLSHSAKLALGFMCYELYQYKKLQEIDGEMKTAINVDLSFEKLDKQLDGKNVLLASMLNISEGRSEWSNDKNEKENDKIILKSEVDDFQNRLIKFKFNTNINGSNVKLATSHDEELKLEIIQNKNYFLFDPINIETIPVKDENSRVNYSALALKDISHYFWFFYLNFVKKSQKIAKVQKGLINNQRLLIYGQLSYIENNKFLIKPKYFIGSGLVEFEEIIEIVKNHKNLRLFNIVLFMLGLGVLHLGYSTFFTRSADKKIITQNSK